MLVARLTASILLITIEPFLRILARLISYNSKKSGFGLTEVIRGGLIGFITGSTRLRVGENVIFSNVRRIQIGKNVKIFDNAQLICQGNSVIQIGDNSHVGRNTLLSGSAGLNIGRYCAISSGVRVYTVSNSSVSKKVPITQQVLRAPISIGDNVLVGANAVLLPGCTIGNNAIIAAGAVIKGTVPAGAVFGGVPGKLIK